MTSTHLHVEDTGGAGTPVVLLHSSGLSGRQWRRLVPALTERGLRAVVVDLSGHGASPAWPAPQAMSYRNDVEEIVAVLESLPGPAHLVGHSYGALIAVLAAHATPSRVRSVVAIEPVAFGALDPARDGDALADLDAVAIDWGTDASAHDRWLQAFVDYWSGEGAWLQLREEARAEFRRVGWAVNQGVVTLVQDKTPATAYARLGAGLHLITGELSTRAAHRVIERLHEAVADSHVTTIEGAGHMAPLTHPVPVQTAILAALAEAEAPR